VAVGNDLRAVGNRRRAGVALVRWWFGLWLGVRRDGDKVCSVWLPARTCIRSVYPSALSSIDQIRWPAPVAVFGGINSWDRENLTEQWCPTPKKAWTGPRRLHRVVAASASTLDRNLAATRRCDPDAALWWFTTSPASDTSPATTTKHALTTEDTMIIWTIGTGAAGSADTRALAAEHACAAVAEHFAAIAEQPHGHNPVTICVDDAEAIAGPGYHPDGTYDATGTARVLHHIETELADALAEV